MIPVSDPNSHVGPKLGDPHRQANKFFQIAFGSFGTLQHGLQVAAQFADFCCRDFNKTCTEVDLPANPLNCSREFAFGPGNRNLGQVAKDE